MPVAVTGYAIYGDFVQNEDLIFQIFSSQSLGGNYGIWVDILKIVLSVYLLFIIPLISNPLMTKFESALVLNDTEDFIIKQLRSSFSKRLLIRSIIVIILTLVASLVPYPLVLYGLGLPAAVSITFDTFIFPVVLNWMAEPPKNIFKGIILVLIMLFGCVSCYYSITEIIKGLNNIKEWENTFAEIFKFSC